MNMLSKQLFENAKKDNDNLAELLKHETNIKLRLVWKYHQFLNWRIMSCVSSRKYTEAFMYATEMKRSIEATQVYVTSLASDVTNDGD